MSRWTQTRDLLLAEVAFLRNDRKRAKQLITRVTVERIRLAAAEVTQTPHEHHFTLEALGNGLIRYGEVILALNTYLKPVVETCAARGIHMELRGNDARYTHETFNFASIRVKYTPKHNL